jgi:hypothetical protein
MTSSHASVSQAFSTPRIDTSHALSEPHAVSARARLAGRILSGIAALFLAFDAAMKLALVAAAVQGTTELGYPVSVIRPLGIVQLICLGLYLWPRSAVLGAVLWTGYLGGAIATHVRLENPLFSHALFPVYVAVLLWGGLFLRDLRVRALLKQA